MFYMKTKKCFTYSELLHADVLLFFAPSRNVFFFISFYVNISQVSPRLNLLLMKSYNKVVHVNVIKDKIFFEVF